MKKLVLLLLFLFAPVANAERTEAEILARGRELTQHFYRLEIDAIWPGFTPELQAMMGGLEAFINYRKYGIEVYGQEFKIFDEVARREGDVDVYIRVASFEKTPNQAWYIVWAIDDMDKVTFFAIRYAGQAPA